MNQTCKTSFAVCWVCPSCCPLTKSARRLTKLNWLQELTAVALSTSSTPSFAMRGLAVDPEALSIHQLVLPDCVRDNRNRTNNILESFHAAFCRRIQVSHPNLFTFVGHLQHVTTECIILFTARRYAKCGFCCLPVSVRLTVTLVDCIQMAEDIVKHLSWSGSPIILVLVFDPAPIPNSKGNPFSRGAKYTGWENFAIFDWNRRLSRKRYEIGAWLLWNVNRKS